jgi:hypothetical protein
VLLRSSTGATQNPQLASSAPDCLFRQEGRLVLKVDQAMDILDRQRQGHSIRTIVQLTTRSAT